MAKKKKQKKKTPQKPQKVAFWDTFSNAQKTGMCMVLIVVVVLIYFYPIVFQGQEPPASDSIAWRTNAQSLFEAREKYNYNPLWANNVFSGMPAHLISLLAPFEQPVRYIILAFEKIINWRALYYILGAIGFFLLMRFLACSHLVATLSSFAFIWWPNIIGLLEAGHNTKVRTIMFLPWILLTFLYFLKKPNLLHISLFAIALSLGFRARHYQILFYCALILLFFGVQAVIPLIKEKQWKGIAIRTVPLLLAVLLALGISAFPALLVQDYSKYSIRGTTGEPGSTGLDFEYATQWSLHPAEMLNLLMPRFFGGHTNQDYEGTAVPQLRGQTIPGYWGHMPFTSTTDYLGVITLFFASLAIAFRWRERTVMTLILLVFLSLLLAFGRHLPAVYKLFFNYFPQFNKFRIPVMSLVIVLFSSAILAGLGLEYLITLSKEKLADKKLLRKVLIIAGIFVFIGLVPFLFKGLFPFMRQGETARYQQQLVPLLMDARYDLMKGDATRMLLFVLGGIAIVFSFIKGWLSRSVFLVLAIALLLADLLTVDNRYLNTLVPKTDLERAFAETPVDGYLARDTSHFRILPLGNAANAVNWSYRFQSAEGYHPAKLRIYQDLREFCLNNGTAPGFENNPNLPLNWNIVNMLNVKYVIAPGLINHQNLSSVFRDNRRNLIVYQNSAYLPRAFLVGEVEVIGDRQRRFQRLNDPAFNPAETAILEEELDTEIGAPGQASVEITRYEPNYIDVKVETDAQALLVLSEVYFPAGWKAFVNGAETKIFKTNHVLRSVLVPEGSSEIQFKLEPPRYYSSLRISGASMIIVYLLLVIALVQNYLSRRKTEKSAS